MISSRAMKLLLITVTFQSTQPSQPTTHSVERPQHSSGMMTQRGWRKNTNNSTTRNASTQPPNTFRSLAM